MLKIKEKLNFNKINEAAYASESDLAYNLLDYLQDEYKLKKQSIEYRAIDIVETIRKSIKTDSPIENLLQEYELNTKEGTVLLCLAEALLRIPDKITMDRLLEDKFSSVDWKTHISFDKGLFVNDDDQDWGSAGMNNVHEASE